MLFAMTPPSSAVVGVSGFPGKSILAGKIVIIRRETGLLTGHFGCFVQRASSVTTIETVILKNEAISASPTTTVKCVQFEFGNRLKLPFEKLSLKPTPEPTTGQPDASSSAEIC